MAGFTAKEENFVIFNQEKSLEIPFFQRKYVWKEANWNELFENFFVKPEPGFLGSIIVQRNQIGAGSGALDVIDGQQRLTTLSVLVMAIYDSIDSKIKENAKSEMQNALFSKGIFNKDYTPKIRHSKFDKADYETIMTFKKDFEKINGKETGIIGCYNHFIKRLEKISEEQKERVLNDFLSGRYLIWVIITLDKDMDEQSIFDTLNNSGVSLTASDTIKNTIFKRVDELYDEEYRNNSIASFDAMNELYTTTWEEAFIKDEETEEYWNQEIVTGRIKRTNLDLFLYCFGVIKGFFSQYDSNVSELTKVYKDYMNGIKTVEEIGSFLNELKDMAAIFKSNIDGEDKEREYTYGKDKTLQRLLHLLSVNSVTTFHPYILKVLTDYEKKPSKINDRLHLLEKYLIINYLNENTTKLKNYNKMCTMFVNDEKKLDEEVAEVTKNIEYRLLNNISNNFASYFLFWIELFRRNELHDEPSLKYTYSLEHIMPQKWKENWFNDVANGLKDEHGKKMDVPSSIEYRDNHIYMLGNMTLLKSRLNSSISNKDFATKIEKIKEYASLKITSNDIIKKYCSKNGTVKPWNEKSIEKRQQSLIEEINKALLY